jgi:ribonuclease HI
VKPVVEIFSSAAYRNGRAGVGVVLRAGGQTTHVIRRAVRAGSPAEAAYRALLSGLWHARTAGTRRVRVYADHAEVVRQLNGDQDLPGELTGVYLQVRAMVNAYRWCELEYLPRELNVEAALAAVEALDEEPVMDDEEFQATGPLPLFVPPR